MHPDPQWATLPTSQILASPALLTELPLHLAPEPRVALVALGPWRPWLGKQRPFGCRGRWEPETW